MTVLGGSHGEYVQHHIFEPRTLNTPIINAVWCSPSTPSRIPGTLALSRIYSALTHCVCHHRHVQADMTAAEIKISQLAGCLEALHKGVTTVLDHFHAAYSPDIADAALDVTIKSGARVVFCPSRASAPSKILPELEWGREPDMEKWQWEKFKEWAARDGGKLSKDGRVTLGLG